MAYDSVRGRMVMYGGWQSDNTLWELEVPCDSPISSQPQSQSFCPGGSVQLHVSASSFGTLSFQWRKGGVPIADLAGRRQGATTATLTLSDLRPDDAGSYDCVVTQSNACGTTVSQAATLVVGSNCPCSPADIATEGDPFLGPDGVLSGADFDLFVFAFFTNARRPAGTGPFIADLADSAGNVGRDGFLTGTDFDVFIQRFFEGC